MHDDLLKKKNIGQLIYISNYLIFKGLIFLFQLSQFRTVQTILVKYLYYAKYRFVLNVNKRLLKYLFNLQLLI